MSGRSIECRTLLRSDPDYPPLLARSVSGAPDRIAVRGDPRRLRQPLLGFFSSIRVPGACILPAYDVVRGLRDAGVPVIGGFQSPLERECLAFLLRGRQPVVACPAREIARMRLSADWRTAIGAGRMLVVSAFEGVRRPTAAMADARNRFVAALADRLFVVHAAPGGRLLRLVDEALRSGTPVYCLDVPENEDVKLAGAIAAGPLELATALAADGSIAATASAGRRR